MSANLVWSLIAMGLAVLFLWFIYRIHSDPNVKFDATDILKHNGRASRMAVIELGAFFATTYVLIHQELEQTLTDTYVAAYGAFWILKGVVQVVKGGGTEQKEQVK